jgi:hypothetical protein
LSRAPKGAYRECPGCGLPLHPQTRRCPRCGVWALRPGWRGLPAVWLALLIAGTYVGGVIGGLLVVSASTNDSLANVGPLALLVLGFVIWTARRFGLWFTSWFPAYAVVSVATATVVYGVASG